MSPNRVSKCTRLWMGCGFFLASPPSLLLFLLPVSHKKKRKKGISCQAVWATRWGLGIRSSALQLPHPAKQLSHGGRHEQEAASSFLFLFFPLKLFFLFLIFLPYFGTLGYFCVRVANWLGVSSLWSSENREKSFSTLRRGVTVWTRECVAQPLTPGLLASAFACRSCFLFIFQSWSDEKDDTLN